MRRGIRRTRQVADDIIAIYRFIRARSPQGAERVFDAIERSIRSLPDTPGIGRRWHSPDPRLNGMRVAVVTPYRNYLIFFRATDELSKFFALCAGRGNWGRLSRRLNSISRTNDHFR
jgi:plasmid stabilization system protein ParE